MSPSPATPDHWGTATLGDLLPIKYGKSLTEKNRNGDGTIPVVGSSGIVGRHDQSLVSGPAIVIGRKGNVGSVLYMPGQFWPIDTVYYASVPDSLSPKFYTYLLSYLNLGRLDRSTAIPGLSRSDYDPIPVPVPPLEEQRRIVEAIETQLTRLDAAVAALKRAQANLKRYRASVLKAAVGGRLVPTEAELARRDGREFESGQELLNRCHVTPALTPDGVRCPKGWGYSTIGDIASVGTGATPLRSRSEFYEDGTIPWITSGALNKSSVSAAKEFVTPRALSETNLKTYPPGTLLVAMYGEGRTRGKCSELLIQATINQAIAAIVLKEPLTTIGRFLHLYLESSYEETRRSASGGVQPNLNLGLVKSIVLPIPPLAEQLRINNEVDSYISQIEALQHTCDLAVVRANRLRAAVLRAAFSGHLSSSAM